MSFLLIGCCTQCAVVAGPGYYDAPMWSYADIADAVADGLAAHERALLEEHAVYGMDSLDEVALHPVIGSALTSAGYGVHREQRYPADRGRHRNSEGERCDFVLTPDERPLRQPDAAATLFDSPEAVDLDDALWLEVKTVAQFTPEGPNRGYGSQLLSTVRRDVTKLSKDAGILHAGLLIVLFVQNDHVADHDLRIWQDRCLNRGLPIAAPCLRQFPIADRMGNALCAIALYPVRHL
jgi:hypothetical protein